MKRILIMVLLMSGMLVAMDGSGYDSSSDEGGPAEKSAVDVLSKEYDGRVDFNFGFVRDLCQRQIAEGLRRRLEEYDQSYNCEGTDCTEKSALGNIIAFAILGAHQAGVPLAQYDEVLFALIDIAGRNPLMQALIRWTPPACAQMVLETVACNACNIGTVRDEHGSLPIHVAARFGYHGIVARLLDPEFGVSVDERDSCQRTPLICAAHNVPRIPPIEPGAEGSNHLKTVELLVTRGAAIDATDAGGQTALHKVVLASADEYCADCKGIIGVLGFRGASQTMRDVNGQRARDIAARKSYFGWALPLFIKE